MNDCTVLRIVIRMAKNYH